MAQRKQRRNKPARVYERHPLYGQIPLVPHRTVVRGREMVYHSYDLDFRPEMPSGAVRGEPHKQHLCFFHNAPMYFYVDQQRTCVQCGAKFAFGAREQKYWYESLGFYGTSVAIRCISCRKRRRTVQALSREIGAAKAAARANPDDVGAWLAVAEATVRYRQRCGQGDLEGAIAAARRARKLAPALTEALLWEGMAQLQAGRTARAAPLLRTVADGVGNSARSRRLKEEAVKRLEEIGEPSGRDTGAAR